MQNYLIQHPLESQLNWIRSLVKRFTAPKKQVPLKQQLSADRIIACLEMALNTDFPVTIQINNSLLSEDVSNIFGYIYQNNNGQLLVQSPKTHEMIIVLPGTIRNITVH